MQQVQNHSWLDICKSNISKHCISQTFTFFNIHNHKTINCFKIKFYIKVFAYEESEKYKEGKFILERHYLAKQSKNIVNSSE